MMPIDLPKTLEEELADVVKSAIEDREHKDFVRYKYDIYLGYLQKDGLHIDKKQFYEVEKLYRNYLRKCKG